MGRRVASADECVDPGGGGCHLPIQAAIDAADPGETINVVAATYVERLTIPKSVVLRGAQAGVDPTPGGARTNPAVESIVDFTSLVRLNQNVEIQIATGVDDVTIDGFTLIGHPNELVADESIIRVGGAGAPTDNDRIVIANNIMQGWKPILFKGGDSDTFTVASNRIVANKNGLVVQFGVIDITASGNAITAGAPLAGDPPRRPIAPGARAASAKPGRCGAAERGAAPPARRPAEPGWPGPGSRSGALSLAESQVPSYIGLDPRRNGNGFRVPLVVKRERLM